MASLANFLKRQPRLIMLLSVVVASTLAVGFIYTKVFVFPSYGGTLSPYLVGYYDLRTSNTFGGSCIGAACADSGTDSGFLRHRTDAAVDLTNPTTTALHAVIALFDISGAFVDCTTRTVSTNETVRVYVNNNILGGNGDSQFGAVKVVTVLDSDFSRVQAGLKGALTHFVTESSDRSQNIFSRSSRLQEVPAEALKANNNAELLRITNTCL